AFFLLVSFSRPSSAGFGAAGGTDPLFVVSSSAYAGTASGTDYGNGVLTLGSNVYVAGYLYANSPDVWLAKYDASMNLVQSTTFTGTGYDVADAIATDGTSLYVAGGTTVGSDLWGWIGKYNTS